MPERQIDKDYFEQYFPLAPLTGSIHLAPAEGGTYGGPELSSIAKLLTPHQPLSAASRKLNSVGDDVYKHFLTEKGAARIGALSKKKVEAILKRGDLSEPERRELRVLQYIRGANPTTRIFKSSNHSNWSADILEDLIDKGFVY